MSFASPQYQIPRRSVVHGEGEWAKMFDPPTASPDTPELVNPTNPVPEIMVASGSLSQVKTPHTLEVDLLHGIMIPTWDGLKDMHFMTIRNSDNPTATGTFPGPTVRVPRGSIFHADTSGHGPPPHTIHWHGIEPTPMNDGVGHCSMEIGHYIYQWQPNFIGSYFYHCHRNTVQHFEFGLYGFMIFEPPDAYYASVVGSDWRAQTIPANVQLNNIPIGACSDGKFRTAANLASFAQFPGYVAGDPVWGVAGPNDVGVGDPHAFTVAYDVESLLVFDDRDSVWSDLAPNARQTYPRFGDIPGVNDNFHGHWGGNASQDDFFAFNDFNADYWYVTGVPVPAHKGEIGTITPAVVPPGIMSGKSGVQVGVNAQVGQTILVRCLDAAYNNLDVTFPVDVVIIAWDGRALGVPPLAQYNEAFLLPAGTTYHISVARRFDALIRPTAPINSFIEAKFINTRGDIPGVIHEVLCTARVPFVVT